MTHFQLETNHIVQEPNSKNCLNFIFAASPCEKVIIVPDTYHITSAEHVKTVRFKLVKIKEAQLKSNLHSPIVH